MPVFNISSEALSEGMDRYFKRMDLAREIDPEAFKPFVTTFTDDQLARQWRAEEQVVRDHPELAPNTR